MSMYQIDFKRGYVILLASSPERAIAQAERENHQRALHLSLIEDDSLDYETSTNVQFKLNEILYR